MDVVEVPLDAIDLDDEAFRISEDLDPSPLRESLGEVGQLNPVILCPNPDARPRIVCGFRRLHALRHIGATCCLARFLPPELRRSPDAFRIALWDNLAQRALEPLEKARVLFTLQHTCGLDREGIVRQYLPILGLDPHKNVLTGYLALHQLDPELRRVCSTGEITASTALRVAGFPHAAQSGMASLFARARFSASLQRQLLDLLDDLAAILECGHEAALAQPEILATLDDPALTPFQRGEAVYRSLYRRRNPRLSAAEDRFQSEKSRLRLPPAVRLSADPFFEKPRLRVDFEASSAEGFREISDALQRAAQAPSFAELFRVR